jgi:2C-methyl-D-erythritol 2,4-cyclodiphosphate synthase
VDKIHSKENVIALIAGEATAQLQSDCKTRDILLFALGDALLGALGQDGLEEFLKNNINSDSFRVEDVLKEIERQLYYTGWKILNTDISIRIPNTLEETLNPHIIANKVASSLFINSEQVNIKWNFQIPNANINHLHECYVVVLIGPRDS